MSDETSIARVYADALFEAAAEEGKVEAVRRDLTAFTDAVATNAALGAFFSDEEIGSVEKTHTVLELTGGGEPLVRNFLRLLVDKERESILDEMTRLYVRRVEAASGVVKVELTTARPLPQQTQDEVRRNLGASLAKTVDMTVTVDERILGGVKLRIGDRIADASVRHSLDELRARLVKPTATLEVER